MSDLEVCYLRVALIHNDDENRLKYLRPKLQSLKSAISKQVLTSVLEYNFQPPLEKLEKKNLPTYLFRLISDQVNFFVNTRRWEKYKRNNKSKVSSVLASQIRNLFLPLNSFQLRSKFYLKRLNVMRMLTDKHIRAWSEFIENGKQNEFLLVVEDDLIFKADSTSRLMKICLDLFDKSRRSDTLIYLDLAGGLEVSRLQVENLISHRIKDEIQFRTPVTNTTCAYLINLRTAELFYKTVFQNPNLRNLGPDWTINSIFMINEDLFLGALSSHYDPTIFIHGSFQKYYETSIGAL